MVNKKTLTDFARVINSDRYQYTESDIFVSNDYYKKSATFDLFFRTTEDGGFAVVSGVNEVLDLIKTLNETSSEVKRAHFKEVIKEEHLVDFLSNLKFTGTITGMREGEIVYPNEPILTIKAPLIESKILETPILNIMNMHMAIATKASRITRAANGVPVSAFGTRRAHGFDSAVGGSKAAYIGGCVNHSNLVAEFKYGIPSIGTMAHSYVQAFGVGRDAEKKAFDEFIKCRKDRVSNSLILLIDTYSTLKIGIKNAIASFKENGIDDSYDGVYGIRIDSGDLAFLSKKCRKALDDAGLFKAQIVLTNSIDESILRSLNEQGASVNMYGVGDAIAVSKSRPCFGGVYKISEVDNDPVIKLSEDTIKISNPGYKEVYRLYDSNNIAYADLITLTDNDSDRDTILAGEEILLVAEGDATKKSLLKKGRYSIRPLTIDLVRDGKFMEIVESFEDVTSSRNYYLEELKTISPERKRLENPHKYKVNLSKDLTLLKYNLISKIKKQIKEDF